MNALLSGVHPEGVKDQREMALRVACWCGASEGQACQGRPPLEDASRRRQRVSLHRWRYAKALEPGYRLPGAVEAHA